MLLAVINESTYAKASDAIKQALLYADALELRLDYFEPFDLNDIKQLRSDFQVPMVFTLKGEHRLDDIRRLAELAPDYLDLESSYDPHFIAEIKSKFPHIKLILSTHDFEKTPQDLDKIYQEMKRIPAHFYKMAFMANSGLDAMRLILFAKDKEQLIAISMGPCGQISRILAPTLGAKMTYACLNEEKQTAPGQLSCETLVNRYHAESITPSTALYGLIGDPVSLSLSDQTHNKLMQSLNLDAVYVKIPVTALELPGFLEAARKLKFKGLSVTMPLKVAIIPFLDRTCPEAEKIGAVNTLCFDGDTITGYNTDGKGALNAIEELCPVKNKKIVILGAGGAAKGVAYEGASRGALITILTRAQMQSGALSDDYDILINCTPAPMPILAEDISPGCIVMDIKSRPKMTLFLIEAQKKGCALIFGYQMFVQQALGQFALWFKGFPLFQGELIIKEALMSAWESIERKQKDF